jgi:phenylalanyl-tRNA synthetase beta chain
MRVSLKWLGEYVEIPDDIASFCDRLDLTGTGVEGVESAGASLDHVVIGRIVEKKPHPDSDHMFCTLVDVGKRNVDDQGHPVPLEIVCGAQNFNEGDRIPVAMVGAELPGGIVIKKSKLRGKPSYGMNCSARELGLGEDVDGLFILPEDAPIGEDFARYQGISDTILDLEITPNRPDCLSMEGMAREVGAIYRIPVSGATTGFDLAEGDDPTASSVEVDIADPRRCQRYTARLIRNVKVGPSPDWLAQRVAAAGARSINNVVDATNYVLFLLGQPLHAFDYDNLDIEDGRARIIVRAAAEGEKLTTLDGEERTLSSDMTVIATPQRAVALAGVMGGLDSEVTDETCTVLLETATFNPAHTSRTSRNLGLISESSIRYERTVDASTIARNADFAAALIAGLTGGTVCRGLVDEWPVEREPVRLGFRISRFCAMMGADIPRSEIIDVLVRLGCGVSDTQTDVLDVQAPSFRPDLEREIDLYEEVLRLYGMEKIEPTLPGGRGRIGRRSTAELIAAKLHAVLRASGLNETMTYSFGCPDELEKLRMDTFVSGQSVELLNPINADQSIMRQSIIPGLLRSVAYNQNHGVANIQLYEMGNVFAAHEGSKLPKEHRKIAGVLAGAMHGTAWNAPSVPFDFFDGKGVVENIARELALPKTRFKALAAEEAPFLQPGRAASVSVAGAVIGWVGELHPLAVRAYDAAAPVIAFELDTALLEKAARPSREYMDVSEFPAVSMDVAFVVGNEVADERMVQCMRSAGGKLLADVHLFDVYRDEQRIGAGKKSMAYALQYRAADRTLTSEEVDKAHARLVKKVCAATGAEVRG